MLKSLIDYNENWQPVAEKPAIGTPVFNNATLPDGGQYVLQSGTITYKSKGKKVTADQDDNLGYALTVSPDKKQLVVAGKHSHWQYDYTIEPDGRLANKQTLYWLHNPGNDDTTDVRSMAFDTNGNLYVATELGVQVCDQNGRVRAILSLPDGSISSLWFGGEKMDTLFVVCGNKLYKRKLKATGAVSSQKAIIPPSQGAG